jgi:preprotein translocase subunit SecD
MVKFVIMLMVGALSLGAASWLPPGCAQKDRVQLLLEAQTDRVPTNAMMDRAREVLERRIRAFASHGATVTRQGPNRIVVRLGRVEDAEGVKALVGQRGRLEFRLVDQDAPEEQVIAGQAPPGSESLPIPQGGPQARIAVQRRAIVTGAMIVDARQSIEASGRPVVMVRFDDTGTRRLARATRENVSRPLAIVLDDVVVSAPLILEPILGGEMQIAGGFTRESANQLAIVLRSGPLPVRLRVIEERQLGH